MGILLRDPVFLHASKLLLLIPTKGQVPRDDLENSPIFVQKKQIASCGDDISNQNKSK